MASESISPKHPGPAALERAKPALGAPPSLQRTLAHLSPRFLADRVYGEWVPTLLSSQHSSQTPSPTRYLQPSLASKLLLIPQHPAPSFLALTPFPSQPCPWVS